MHTDRLAFASVECLECGGLGQRVAVTLKSADATTASLEFVLAGSR